MDWLLEDGEVWEELTDCVLEWVDWLLEREVFVELIGPEVECVDWLLEDGEDLGERVD